MKDIGCFAKIYIATTPADFRKQGPGLISLVKNELGLEPLNSKSLFVFTNKRRTSIRLVYWDHTGIALWSKALEQDRFKWPKKLNETHSLVLAKELRMLLEGVDLSKIKKHESVDYAYVS